MNLLIENLLVIGFSFLDMVVHFQQAEVLVAQVSQTCSSTCCVQFSKYKHGLDFWHMASGVLLGLGFN
jgi:hypothetical protein